MRIRRTITSSVRALFDVVHWVEWDFLSPGVHRCAPPSSFESSLLCVACPFVSFPCAIGLFGTQEESCLAAVGSE